jgi:type IX secretion system PorP/SprF family membrane protein
MRQIPDFKTIKGTMRMTPPFAMISKTYAILVCTFLFAFLSKSHAQEGPLYSQYMFNMLNINPAYAGNRAVNNFNLVHRDQWVGFDKNPQTTFISWDKRKEESNAGYGIQVYNDRLGLENTTGIQGFYSYRVPFDNQSTLSLGLSAGILNFNGDYTGATLMDQILNGAGALTGDPAFQQNETKWVPTFGFGALYFQNLWYVGFSMPTLLKTIGATNPVGSSTENTKDPFRGGYEYYLTGGYIFELTNDLVVKPSTLIKYTNGSPLQMDFNFNLWWENKYGIGVSYRTGNAYVGLLEWQITTQFRVGYAYDYYANSLMPYNAGTHELMLRFEYDSSGKSYIMQSPRYY